MTTENINIQQFFTQFSLKNKAVFQLLKFRLSATVVFSAGMAYILGNPGTVDWLRFSVFVLAGFLVTASSNILNQIYDIAIDI